MKIKIVAGALLAVGLAGPLQAAVVGGAPDWQNGLLATSWVGGPGGAAATRFTVGAGGFSFNSLSWWGSYNYFGNTDYAHGVLNELNNFTFTLYSVGNGGLPGAMIGNPFLLGSGNGQVDPLAPAPEADSQFTAGYRYSVGVNQTTLGEGSYYASLSNAYAYDLLPDDGQLVDNVSYDWYWGSTGDPAGQQGAAFRYAESEDWNSGAPDGVGGLAFQLLGPDRNNVPEPGSAALLALALAGLAVSRRQVAPQPARFAAI